MRTFRTKLRAGQVEVRGTVLGVIWSEEEVVIRASGSVLGGVKGRDIQLEGRVHGRVHADRLLVIAGTARVDASLRAAALWADAGAHCRGNCAFGEALARVEEALQAA